MEAARRATVAADDASDDGCCCLAREVTRAVQRQYAALPKQGKPQGPREWTILAGIVMTQERDSDQPIGDPQPEDERMPQYDVVALATGSKCLGYTQVSSEGDVVIDCHAEVLARRAFRLYLNDQLRRASYNHHSHGAGTEAHRPSIFEVAKDGSAGHKHPLYTLKKGVSFHLYVSQTPCGDASIFPMDGQETCMQKQEVQGQQRQATLVTSPAARKKAKFADSARAESEDHGKDPGTHEKMPGMVSAPTTRCGLDMHRTGAKPVPNGPQDPKGGGILYHREGCYRTKPGRGPPSRSMSCSDKILQWSFVGLQGALLSTVLEEPVYLSTIVVGRHFHQGALERALSGRLLESGQGMFCADTALGGYTLHEIRCLEAPHDLPFVHAMPDDKGERVGYSSDGSGEQPAAIAVSSCIVYAAAPSKKPHRRRAKAKKDAAEQHASTPTTHEVIVKGILQGKSRKKAKKMAGELSHEQLFYASSVCKCKLAMTTMETLRLCTSTCNGSDSEAEAPAVLATYEKMKRAASHYQGAKAAFLSSISEQWLGNSSAHPDAFAIPLG